MVLDLAFPAFLAGILTFLMPCTLPLIPGYLSFISGVPLADARNPRQRVRIIANGFGYVFGFSVVFILFGSIFAAAGVFVAAYRPILARAGGVLIALLGAYMLGIFRIPFFERPFFAPVRVLRPGTFPSAMLFGAVFALGWTPCIGPILGTILTLAVTSASVWDGAVLLGIFALGLGVPFMLSAIFISAIAARIAEFTRAMRIVSMIGGILLVGIGILIATERFGWWVSYALDLVPFTNSEWFLRHL